MPSVCLDYNAKVIKYVKDVSRNVEGLGSQAIA
jgi:hypothetical protein